MPIEIAAITEQGPLLHISKKWLSVDTYQFGVQELQAERLHALRVTFLRRETIWLLRCAKLRDRKLQRPVLKMGTQTMEELFDQYAEKLFAYLRQHAPSREDAEDILVETFMAALAETKFMHLSEMAQIAWLWRVARNKVADAFRKAAFRRNVSFEMVDEMMCGDETRDPEQMALRQDEALEIHNLLRALPQVQQEMLQLRFGYDLNCREIAAILGKREDAVRMMLSRTMNSLRQLHSQRLSNSQDSNPDKGDWRADKR
jgi:RNA polymerase sigma-70 factor (ECF subfamily)